MKAEDEREKQAGGTEEVKIFPQDHLPISALLSEPLPICHKRSEHPKSTKLTGPGKILGNPIRMVTAPNATLGLPTMQSLSLDSGAQLRS